MDGLAEALKKGARTYADAGSEDAYFGDPTAATAEDGETYFEGLAEIKLVRVLLEPCGVRRARRIGQPQQRVIASEHRLVLVHVDGGAAGPSLT